MGELRSFRSKTSGEALARLVAEMQQSMERSDELGPRDQHVRDAAENLMVFAHQLQAACDVIADILTRLGVKSDNEVDRLRYLATIAERLATTGQNFPKPGHQITSRSGNVTG